jgi:hypothetical protein
MWEVLFWILFALAMLMIIPDRWHARREIAKLQAEMRRKACSANARAKPGGHLTAR